MTKIDTTEKRNFWLVIGGTIISGIAWMFGLKKFTDKVVGKDD